MFVYIRKFTNFMKTDYISGILVHWTRLSVTKISCLWTGTVIESLIYRRSLLANEIFQDREYFLWLCKRNVDHQQVIFACLFRFHEKKSGILVHWTRLLVTKISCLWTGAVIESLIYRRSLLANEIFQDREYFYDFASEMSRIISRSYLLVCFDFMKRNRKALF